MNKNGLTLTKNSKVGIWSCSKLCKYMQAGNACKFGKHECYAVKAARMYKGCLPAWKNNENNFNLEAFQKAFRGKKDKKYFRFNSSCGEMNDVEQFIETFRIAQHNPQTTFYMYTKNHIDYQKALSMVKLVGKPSNLRVGYSFKKLNAHLDSFFPDLKANLENMGYDFFTVVTDIKGASNCLAQTKGATCGKGCTKCMTANKQIIFFEVH